MNIKTFRVVYVVGQQTTNCRDWQFLGSPGSSGRFDRSINKKSTKIIPAKQYPNPDFDRHLSKNVCDEFVAETDSETALARRLARAVFKHAADYTTSIKNYEDFQKEKLQFIEHCIHFYYHVPDRKQQKQMWGRCRDAVNEQRWKISKRLENPNTTVSYDKYSYKIRVLENQNRH